MNCLCGCGIKLRKDNKTGFQRGHKPCPVCGTLVQRSHTECCSKACSATLHHQRHPEMKETRCWNAVRLAKRAEHKDQWTSAISASTKGRVAWNKGQTMGPAWNTGLSTEEQPFYGQAHRDDYLPKRTATNLARYGVANTGCLAKTSSRSKCEKSLESILVGYETNQRVGPFKPDYINTAEKVIIEVYGDYWHCNPTKYEPSYYHKQLKTTAAERWDSDMARQRYFETLGYTVITVWESELDRFVKDYRMKHA
jgi:G:T-mismatch repair DNA endonuclease (very short patch repair protein)